MIMGYALLDLGLWHAEAVKTGNLGPAFCFAITNDYCTYFSNTYVRSLP